MTGQEYIGRLICPLTNEWIEDGAGSIATCLSCKHCLPPGERVDGRLCGYIDYEPHSGHLHDMTDAFGEGGRE